MLHTAVFLDRDRTLNKFEHTGTPGEPDTYNYLLSWDDFEWIDGAIEAIKLLNRETPHLVVVISNQSCVAIEKATYLQISDIFYKMIEDASGKQAIIEDFFFCPHDAASGCGCHKPKPGLFYVASHQLDIDLRNSWSIGDRVTDAQAAFNAGLHQHRTVLVGDLLPWERDLRPRVNAIERPDIYSAAMYVADAL